MPYLKEGNNLRVLDIVPPQDSSVSYVQGSVNDAGKVCEALCDIEGVLYMVLGRHPDGSRNLEDIGLSYELSVTGLHRFLQAMKEAGISRAVYASTLSVHDMRPGLRFQTEDMPCDAPTLYGFTKGLGEKVCEHFCRVHSMTIVSLRINNPVSREDWQSQCRPGLPCTGVSAPDLARAFLLGLKAPISGHHALFIAGDYEGKFISCKRARQVLNWEPMERPRD